MRAHAWSHRFVRFLLVALLCLPMFTSPSFAIAFIDPYEPDDTMETATQISADGVERLQNYEGEWPTYAGHDWLRFEAVAGKVYRLRVRRDTVHSLPSATFFGPDAVALPYESLENNVVDQTWFFCADTTGTHYVDLAQHSSYETGTYFVSMLEGEPGGFGLADAYEPDNTLHSAKSIPVDGSTQERVHEGTDYVRIPVRAGMVYRIRIGWPAGEEYMLTSVITTAGSTILGNEFALFAGLQRYFVAPASGTVFLKCIGAVVPAPYTVSIKEMPRSILCGSVSSRPDAAAFDGARVSVYRTDVAGYYSSHDSAVCTTYTASDGSWSLPVMPGTYGVRFDDPSGRLLTEYYRNVVAPAPHVTPIPTAEETTVAGINGVLWALSGIEGHVVRVGTGEPVSGVPVYLDRIDPTSQYHTIQRVASAVSAGDGSFAFPNLDPRVTHYLSAADTSGLVQVARMTVPLSTGTTSTPEFPLTTPAVVSGRVTDSMTELPIAGARVTVYQGGGGYSIVGSALTAEDGTYSVSLRASGTTKLIFSDPSNTYKSEWWDDSYDVGNPTLFSVFVGNTYEGKDAALYPDAVPPCTNAIGVPQGWAYGPVSVELSADDTGVAGVGTTYYATGAYSTPNIRYSAPILFNTEGVNTLKFYSVDTIGNAESVKTTTIRIDNAPPTTTSDAQRVYNGACTIKLTPTDSGSGAASTRYSLDGAPVRQGTSVSVPRSWGTHALDFSSADNAGRIETTKTAEFVMGVAMHELQGANRIETAVALSRASFPETADAVVLCNDKAWPDALAASGFAGVHNAPILLTPGDSVPQSVLAEMARLAPRRVFVIGGTAVVGEGVLAQLRTVFGAGAVERIYGSDRYRTSIILAERTNADSLLGSQRVFVITGGTFADGIAVSRQAYAEHAGMLYVRPRATAVAAEVPAFLLRTRINVATIIGGTAAVSADVETQLRALKNPYPMTVTRISGSNRYETSLAVVGATESLEGLTIVSGASFPDALCAGPFAARQRSPMVLVPGTSLGPLDSALASRGAAITRMNWIGGVAAITTNTRLRAAAVLGTPYLLAP